MCKSIELLKAIEELSKFGIDPSTLENGKAHLDNITSKKDYILFNM